MAIPRWFRPLFKRQQDQLRSEDLADLERVMGQWHQALSFGPVPGAYLSWTWSNDFKGVPPTFQYDMSLVAPADLRVIAVGGFLDAGTATMNLLSGATTIGTFALTTTPTTFNHASDFSSVVIKKNEVVDATFTSVVSATRAPITLTVKNVGKIG